jgi:hypothetical protein
MRDTAKISLAALWHMKPTCVICGGVMKHILFASKYALFACMILCAAVYASAQEKTEVYGYYQTYRNFSFQTGLSDYDVPATKLNGGGFGIARNFAPWFAMWTQFSFFGTVQQPNMGVRVINNLEGFRYQTKQYGPVRLYAKGGLGFSNYSMDIAGNSLGETKFSVAYGGGAQIWFNDWLGVVLDASHVVMGLPNLTDMSSREKWDSGLVYTTALSIRF